MDAPFVTLTISTDAGRFVARYSAKGLAELNFPANGRASLPVGQDAQQRAPAIIRNWHQTTEAALKSILAGHSPKKFPPLDWAGKAKSQKAVWRAMLKIPVGRTKSYGEMARAIGRPKAGGPWAAPAAQTRFRFWFRAIACSAANQKIGGFSSGLDREA